MKYAILIITLLIAHQGFAMEHSEKSTVQTATEKTSLVGNGHTSSLSTFLMALMSGTAPAPLKTPNGKGYQAIFGQKQQQ